MLRVFAAVLLCSCATAPAPVPPGQACEHEYQLCNNGCFRSPNYKHNGPQCAQAGYTLICPQENQPVDTLAAARCFDQCETEANLCR